MFRVIIQTKDFGDVKSFLDSNAVSYTYNDPYDYFDETLNNVSIFLEDMNKAFLLSHKFKAPLRKIK